MSPAIDVLANPAGHNVTAYLRVVQDRRPRFSLV